MPIRAVRVSLNDVEEQILSFEQKYRISSPEFFGSQEIRQRMPEDDVYAWEMLIYHRAALRETYQAVQKVYLSNLDQSSCEVRADKETQELLAA